MDWQALLGHDRQRAWFRNAWNHNRLASTFLLVGPEGIGKRTFARLIAKTALCTGNDPRAFAPCGGCEACSQVDASTHPDLIEICRDPDRTALTMKQLVGEDETRMREGLCYELRMKPYSGRRKIAIVDDADTIATEGANALLKTLEEPPAGSLIFLISTSAQRQLPTIRSRCQMIRFQPLQESQVAQLVMRNSLAKTEAIAQSIAAQSQGSMSQVSLWLDESLKVFQEDFVSQLASRPLDFVRLAKSVQTHLEGVGSEGQARRDRIKILIDRATRFYRDVIKSKVGVARQGTELSDTLPAHLLGLHTETLTKALVRCLEAREHVDRMVGPAPLLESWCADLAAICGA